MRSLKHMSQANIAPMVPSRKAKRESPEQRREDLLRSAVKVFAEHGLEVANHSMLATEAGVSVSLCFHYFKTYDALLDAVLGEVEKLYVHAFRAADNPDKPAPVSLIAVADTLMSKESSVRQLTQIFVEWSTSVRSSHWERFTELHRFIVGVLARVIQRGQTQGFFRIDMDPEDEAEFLHATSFVLAQLRMLNSSEKRIQRFKHAMFQRLYRPGTEKPRINQDV